MSLLHQIVPKNAPKQATPQAVKPGESCPTCGQKMPAKADRKAYQRAYQQARRRKLKEAKE